MLVESVVLILCDIFYPRVLTFFSFFFWLTALYLVYGSLLDMDLIVQTTEEEFFFFFFFFFLWGGGGARDGGAGVW
mgnify:CR=1 FL=1